MLRVFLFQRGEGFASLEGIFDAMQSLVAPVEQTQIGE
jgi:hypothetical protein